MIRLALLFCLLPVLLTAQTPWYHHTTIYQIYPRSFLDTDGNGVGDLEGIIQKLDYIKSTGFETIWISPFYQSPQQDHGYDVSDYYTIDPLFGDLETAKRLIDEVHQRDMKIVFDMVLNHTSDQHEWFKESAGSKDNPKADWYVWADGDGNKPPNNWKSTVGGPAWHYVSERDQYYYAAFLPFQPDLNYHNPAVKKAMLGVVRYWLEQGVDGFRLDLFNSMMEDEALTDNPPSTKMILTEDEGFFQKMEYTLNHPDNLTFAEELRAVMDSFDNPPRFLLGEVFGDYHEVKEYVGDGQNRLHFAFLFDMLTFDFNANYFRKKLSERELYFADPYVPVYVFCNHDRKRSISRVGNDPQKAKLLAAFLLTVRGVPVMFMGEEIGMTQAKIPLSRAQDPLAIKYRWLPQWLVNMSSESLNRDECRTPIQWNTEAHAGFSDTIPWLPVQKNYLQGTNVADQLAQPNSMWSIYNKLLELRKEHPALHSGSLEILEDGFPKKVLAYKRKYQGEELVVLLNFSGKAQQIELDASIVQLYPKTTKPQNQLQPWGFYIYKSGDLSH